MRVPSVVKANFANRLFHDFKVDPLGRGSVFLAGEEIGDGDLKHIFTGSHVSPQLQRAARHDALRIRLPAQVYSLLLALKDYLPVAQYPHRCN